MDQDARIRMYSRFASTLSSNGALIFITPAPPPYPPLRVLSGWWCAPASFRSTVRSLIAKVALKRSRTKSHSRFDSISHTDHTEITAENCIKSKLPEKVSRRVNATVKHRSTTLKYFKDAGLEWTLISVLQKIHTHSLFSAGFLMFCCCKQRTLCRTCDVCHQEPIRSPVVRDFSDRNINFFFFSFSYIIIIQTSFLPSCLCLYCVTLLPEWLVLSVTFQYLLGLVSSSPFEHVFVLFLWILLI